MGDVVDFMPSADRRASKAHEELCDALTDRMVDDPAISGVIVVTMSANGLTLWSERYRDGLEKARILGALNLVRKALEARDDPA
jgi:hypothetical protein